MKKFQVSLEVISHRLTLSELTDRLGTTPSSGSHSKGDPRGPGQFSSTVWKLFSSLAETATLQDHIKDIARLFLPGRFANVLPDECKVCINIGLMFDSWNSVLLIDHDILGIVHAYKAEIELSCYPE